MDEPSDSLKKRVDEDWKERAQRERAAKAAEPQKAEPIRPGQSSSRMARPGRTAQADPFSLFLSSLSMQTLMALGEMPHPATGQPHEDLEQAHYLIDVLGMLQEKTKGNLTQEEMELLESLLYELRMKYVKKAEG